MFDLPKMAGEIATLEGCHDHASTQGRRIQFFVIIQLVSKMQSK
jgi:hypothetical protein